MSDNLPFDATPLSHTFTAPIGVNIKGSTWECVEMPGSAAFFGTKKSLRADIEIDGIAMMNKGLMVTGTGGHMISLDAKTRKSLGKGLGDNVTVRLLRRVK
jgi:hypothetical protein